MSVNDPLGDMLARIRNGLKARLASITCPASQFLESVLKVLQEEGYIVGYSRQPATDGKYEQFKIELKYYEGRPVISELKRVSKPGRRVYYSVADMLKRKPFNGLGAFIVSTSKGVLSSHQAQSHNIGGEVLCIVY